MNSTAPNDYESTPLIFTLSNETLSGCVLILTFADDVIEDAEDFGIRVLMSPCMAPVMITEARGVIRDIDGKIILNRYLVCNFFLVKLLLLSFYFYCCYMC